MTLRDAYSLIGTRFFGPFREEVTRDKRGRIISIQAGDARIELGK